MYTQLSDKDIDHDDDNIEEKKIEEDELDDDTKEQDNQIELALVNQVNQVNQQNITKKQEYLESKKLSYFGEESWFSKIFQKRDCIGVIHFILQIWTLLCGIISLLLCCVFYMNLICEYIILSWTIGYVGILSGIAVFFLVVCLSFFVRRQFESLVILCRNTLDYCETNNRTITVCNNCELYINIVITWRVVNVFLCVTFSIFSVLHNEVEFTDVLAYQIFLQFMFYFGFVFQIWYTLCCIIASFYAIKCKHADCKNCDDFFKFFTEISTQDFQDSKSTLLDMCGLAQCICKVNKKIWNCFQYLVIKLIFVLIIGYFILGSIINDNGEIFVCGAVIMIIYLIITLLENGRCNALFLLWSGCYQDYIKQNQLANDSMDKMYSDKSDSDNENVPVTNDCIPFMTYWEHVPYDYKWNGFFGCNKYCRFIQNFMGWICIGIFILLLLIVPTYVSVTNKPVETIPNILQSMPTYPICDMELRENHYLSIMDLILLTQTAYHYKSKKEIMQQYEIWFGDNYNESWDISTLMNHSMPSFYHIHNKEYNFDLVSVRGTAEQDDIIQDIGLWSEAATFQTFSSVVPLTQLFPVNFIRRFIKFASTAESIIAPSIRHKYDEPVYNFIKKNIMTNGDDYVIIVGHSLGGGISQIVGARLFEYDRLGNDNIISFGLSSPGTLYSSKKFGFTPDSLDKTSVSVLPERDIVSMIDKHGGVVQTIECYAKAVGQCHLAATSFCEMYQECGNQTIRNVPFVECVCDGIHTYEECIDIYSFLY